MNQVSMRLLRRSLMADGVVSGLSGLAFVLFPGPVAALLGLQSGGVVAGVGVTLVIFGALVARNASRESPRRNGAVLTVAMNLAWVVGSVAAIAAGWLSPLGNWAVGLVAEVVLTLAILEGIGLRRASGEPANA
jgi:hypothetical protein